MPASNIYDYIIFYLLFYFKTQKTVNKNPWGEQASYISISK